MFQPISTFYILLSPLKSSVTIAFAKCLLEGKDPSLYDFVNNRNHLAQCLPQGIIPEFPKVLAEHLPHVLNKVVHIQLKPVSKNIEDYEVDFLCVMFDFM